MSHCIPNDNLKNPARKPPKDDRDGDVDGEEETGVKWSAAEEATLVETLLEQTRLGFQAELGFKAMAWTAIAYALTAEHHHSNPKAVTQIKHRWQWASQYIIYSIYFFLITICSSKVSIG